MDQDRSFRNIAEKYGLIRLYPYRFVFLTLVLILFALSAYNGFAMMIGALSLGALFMLVLSVIFSGRSAARIRLLARKNNGHVQAQQGLISRLSAERLAELLPDPLVFFDHNGTILYFNEAAAVAFPQLKLQVPIYLCFRSPEMHALFQAVIADGETRSADYRERLPFDRCYHASMMAAEPGMAAETEISVAVQSEAFPVNAGSYTLILRDQSELQRIDRMRSDFVANASHELRTPLASLRGFIETLQGPARDDARARERFLIIMQQQADRMARLIDDLLSLSRLEVKPAVAHSEQVDIAALITHVTDTLAPLAAGLGVAIIWQQPQQAVPVTGDRDELIQVFQNLIENACKYGQSGKQVVISIVERKLSLPEGRQREETPSEPAVKIQDFGPGIPAKDLPRLTERFYRVDINDGKKYTGTGLGLAIVKHILNRHRARLTIRSQIGAGTVFTVIFSSSVSTSQSPPEKIL